MLWGCIAVIGPHALCRPLCSAAFLPFLDTFVNRALLDAWITARLTRRARSVMARVGASRIFICGLNLCLPCLAVSFRTCFTRMFWEHVKAVVGCEYCRC